MKLHLKNMSEFHKYLKKVNEKLVKDYPFQLYWSDGIRQAKGFNNIELALKYAKENKLKWFELFKGGRGFHSTSQEEYLIYWADTKNSSYWYNRSLKEPELLKKKYEITYITENAGEVVPVQAGEVVKLQKPDPDAFTNKSMNDNGTPTADCTVCGATDIIMQDHICQTILDTTGLEYTGNNPSNTDTITENTDINNPNSNLSIDELFKKYNLTDGRSVVNSYKRSTKYDTQRSDKLSENTRLISFLRSIPYLEKQGYSVKVKTAESNIEPDRDAQYGEREWENGTSLYVMVTQTMGNNSRSFTFETPWTYPTNENRFDDLRKKYGILETKMITKLSMFKAISETLDTVNNDISKEEYRSKVIGHLKETPIGMEIAPMAYEFDELIENNYLLNVSIEQTANEIVTKYRMMY